LTTGPNARPGEKPPTFPEAARHHTLTGAVAMGGFYFEALDWTIATNDAASVVEISAKGCQACARVVAAVETLHRKGQVETGGRITVHRYANVVGAKFDQEADYVIRVVYDEGAVHLKQPGHATKMTVPASKNAVSLVFVSWGGAMWKVVEVAQA
jgi:hypothetical protein